MSSKHSRAAISMARNLGVIDGKKADDLHKLKDDEEVFDSLDASLTAYHEQHGSSDEKRSSMYESIFVDTEFDDMYF